MSAQPWTAAYAANEAVWLASDASAGDKQNAWRAQKLLLAHATCNLNEANHFDVLKQHQDKRENDRCTETYMQECLSGCQGLLDQSRRRRAATGMPVEWSVPLESAFERHCRGRYESCIHDEITTNELQRPMANSNRTPLNPPVSTATASPAFDGFRTAREQLMLHDMKKNKQSVAAGTGLGSGAGGAGGAPSDIMNYRKKSLGGRGRSVNAKFVQPIGQNDANVAAVPVKQDEQATPAVAVPPSLAHLDPLMVEHIMRDSMHKYKPIAWEDIAGLEYAKSTFMETIIHPLQRPDLFKGVRRPPRGVLLFGPPGTGKTLIAKCIASQSRATFFSINPSSLTSKWVGEGEKLVKTLFAVAAVHQPAIIFMDEVDSLLSQRSDNEHESSRRLKNEFFIQLDGAATNEDDHIVIIGATNRPQELDEAVRRRFVRRIYVSLPAAPARQQIIEKLIQQVHHNLDEAQVQGLAELTEGYSGADMDSLCRYAAMQPLRALSSSEIDAIDAQQLPAVTMSDFMCALQHVSKSVSPEDVERYVAWNEIYGIKR
ncbi:fidgetin-like protein 1 [Drosophila novamexicana]|uniref:fidgetin-like protein 1 n=1 Tax=Drosophila novamexicana TaxID=47314 RepID=UPI0011E5E0CE|nr:fidgetin-like protein 1 [Drosophila novamexicana]